MKLFTERGVDFYHADGELTGLHAGFLAPGSEADVLEVTTGENWAAIIDIEGQRFSVHGRDLNMGRAVLISPGGFRIPAGGR